MAEREIPIEWLERVLDDPKLIEPVLNEPDLENRFARISEFGDRVLRVVVNKELFLSAS